MQFLRLRGEGGRQRGGGGSTLTSILDVRSDVPNRRLVSEGSETMKNSNYFKMFF